MTDTVQEQLLSLIRSALWGKEADTGLFSGGTDWTSVFRLAQRHTVIGLAYDGACTLPQMMQPGREVLMTAHAFNVRNINSHILVEDVLQETVRKLREAGIRCVLLKGQGLARNWPDPMKRTCGDIDLYVGDEAYARACRLLEEWGMTGPRTSESIQHLHFRYRKVTIEIHRIAGIMYGFTRNRRFRKWSDTLLQSSSCRHIRSGNEDIILPPVRFDAMFIFYHIYRHILTSGVGLRQCCDCVTFLHRFASEIDRQALHDDLKTTGLLRGWQIFGHIATRHLGLPQEEFPLFSDDSTTERLSWPMLEMILRNGNFGFYAPGRENRPDGYLSGKIFSMVRALRHMGKMVQIFPRDAVSYTVYFMSRGIRHLFTDLDRK